MLILTFGAARGRQSPSSWCRPTIPRIKPFSRMRDSIASANLQEHYFVWGRGRSSIRTQKRETAAPFLFSDHRSKALYHLHQILTQFNEFDLLAFVQTSHALYKATQEVCGTDLNHSAPSYYRLHVKGRAHPPLGLEINPRYAWHMQSYVRTTGRIVMLQDLLALHAPLISKQKAFRQSVGATKNAY